MFYISSISYVAWKSCRAWGHCESFVMAAMAATATRGAGAWSSLKASTAKEASPPQTMAPCRHRQTEKKEVIEVR